ncbi:putative LysM domain-containing protein [Senna tora]|uniref:Putative LysM domain-containing protein n=1 Tax=Senna tora TaxID=362788 RepID=A0A834SHA2_9FABA|nr:putative LysM domain-containing protein [Senna tora]
MASIAASRPTPTVEVAICNQVHGVEEGETCSSVGERFKLDQSHFLEINPNINCALMFVGQWVCIDGRLI